MVIPSFDRPTELCSTTLALLASEGVPMCNVNVFVSPSTARPGGQPEWYRYREACKTHGFADVNIRPGGRTLDEQMEAAMEWVGKGYMIVMSDTVRHLVTREETPNGAARAMKAAIGSVAALIQHGYELLQATGCTAWSVNPSHRPQMLSPLRISRRLGLLDGNLTGMLLPPDWRKMKVTKGHGLIYDVEWSAALWHYGHRFCRYQGVCCEHTYRQPGGQATLLPDPMRRRRIETNAIKMCAKKYPDELRWVRKPRASLKTMEYAFKTQGPPPLTMTLVQRGRKRKYSLAGAASSQERMARLRANGGKKAECCCDSR